MRLAFIPASCLPYALDNYHQKKDHDDDHDRDDHDGGYIIDARAFQEVLCNHHRIGSSDECKKTQLSVTTGGGGGGGVLSRDDHNNSDGGSGSGAVVLLRGVTGELAWDGDIGVMKR